MAARRFKFYLLVLKKDLTRERLNKQINNQANELVNKLEKKNHNKQTTPTRILCLHSFLGEGHEFDLEERGGWTERSDSRCLDTQMKHLPSFLNCDNHVDIALVNTTFSTLKVHYILQTRISFGWIRDSYWKFTHDMQSVKAYKGTSSPIVFTPSFGWISK